MQHLGREVHCPLLCFPNIYMTELECTIYTFSLKFLLYGNSACFVVTLIASSQQSHSSLRKHKNTAPPPSLVELDGEATTVKVPVLTNFL